MDTPCAIERGLDIFSVISLIELSGRILRCDTTASTSQTSSGVVCSLSWSVAHAILVDDREYWLTVPVDHGNITLQSSRPRARISRR